MRNLFEQLKRKFVALGATVEVTLKSLSLGAQHATTGIYVKGYSESTIDMIFLAESNVIQETPVGQYTQLEAIGITNTEVFEGDEIVNADDNTFLIIKVVPQNIGDQTFYTCTLRSTLPDSTSEGRVYPPPAPPTEGGISLNVGYAFFEPLTLSAILDSIDISDHTSNTCSLSTVLATIDVQSHTSNTCSLSTVLATSVV